MIDAMMGKGLYSFIDGNELALVQLDFESRPLTIEQMRDFDCLEDAKEKYRDKTPKELKEMFKAVKYEYNEYKKKDRRYSKAMFFIKSKLSEENR
jgi:hypothetical protein